MQETEMDFREETKLQVGIDINEVFRLFPKIAETDAVWLAHYLDSKRYLTWYII